MSTKNTVPIKGNVTTAELIKKLPEDYDALVIPVFKGEDGLELAATGLFDEAVEVGMWELLAAVGAKGNAGEITRIPAIEGLNCDFIVAVGLGENEKLNDETLRRATGAAARSLAGVGTVVTTVGTFGLAPAVEGFVLGSYNYRGVRSEDKADPALGRVLFLDDRKGSKDEFETAVITAESVILARNFVNTPSSHLYPESYANAIADEAIAAKLKVEILDEKQLAKEGFGGILAVGMGSARKPRLVRITYKGKKAKKHVALVGKGITFDTGGISLKPGAQMDNMISDMGGSAAMVATIIGAARLGLAINITATLPLAENMPGGNAYRPGDVITHYGGKTSEILNTDAEGRLVLSDAIARASEDEPDYLLEVATLTGAQMVALGDRTSGVMGSEKFRDRVAATGREVGEKAWAMPIPEEVAEAVKSPVADIRNVTGSRSAGMSAAGAYLECFVGEGIEWAHVDIAGPSYNTGAAYGYTPKRASGVPVRTFLKVLADLAAKKK